MAENVTIMDAAARIEGAATEALRLADRLEANLVGTGNGGVAKDEKTSNPSVMPVLLRVGDRMNALLAVLRSLDKSVRETPKPAEGATLYIAGRDGRA